MLLFVDSSKSLVAEGAAIESTGSENMNASLLKTNENGKTAAPMEKNLMPSVEDVAVPAAA
jgi:hypothetical protein